MLLNEYSDLVAGMGDEIELGVLLHSIADSYSHEGFLGFASPRNDRGGWGQKREVGHGEAGNSPDLPFLDSGRAVDAAIAVLHTIEKFASLHGLVRKPDVNESSLRIRLSANFSEFRAGSREEQWKIFTESEGIPVQTYRSNPSDPALGGAFNAGFLRAAGLQRAWMQNRIRPNLCRAMSYWRCTDFEGLR